MNLLRHAKPCLFFLFFFWGTTSAQEVNIVATFPLHVVAAGEDANQYPLVHVLNGTRFLELSQAQQRQPIDVPVGTTVFLRLESASGTLGYTIDPPRGVLESPPGSYHLPRGVIGLARAVGTGTATITVAEVKYKKATESKNISGCSNCWSGYVINGGPFAFVQGQWRVPTIQEQGGSQVSSAWIGIDGDGVDPLIQVGTGHDYDCCIFGPSYFAWYQVLPQDQHAVGIGYPVAPGDLMMAWISALGPDGNPTNVPPAPGASALWVITLNNSTQHWVFSKTVTFAGPLASAEWIVEAPTVCGLTGCSVGQIANYGSIVFDIMDYVCPPGGTGSCTATPSDSPNFNPSQAISIAQPGPNGWTYFSTPSAPDGDLDGFTVQYSAYSQVTPLPPGPVFINTGLPNAFLNQPYSQNLSQSLELIQDSAPQWQLVGGSLPVGLSLNPTSGVIAGSPTSAGAFAFTLLVTDNNNPGASAQQQISLNVAASPPPPDFSLSASPTAVKCGGSTKISVASMNGFTGQVNLAEAPNNFWSTQFNPSILTLPGMPTSSVTIGQGDPCDAGPNSVQVVGSSGSLSHTLGIGVKTGGGQGDGHCGRVIC
jgi:hypothetical protein